MFGMHQSIALAGIIVFAMSVEIAAGQPCCAPVCGCECEPPACCVLMKSLHLDLLARLRSLWAFGVSWLTKGEQWLGDLEPKAQAPVKSVDMPAAKRDATLGRRPYSNEVRY